LVFPDEEASELSGGDKSGELYAVSLELPEDIPESDED
jgi:hypothetical protein